MTVTALVGARIVQADEILDDHALIMAGGRILALVRQAEIPAGADRHDLAGGWLLPGFIDPQVNGGGDVLFNDNPSFVGLQSILTAHRRFGTTGCLPTLISDSPHKVTEALEAVSTGLRKGLPGLLGIHLEGPHLSPAKRGIHHEPSLTRLTREKVDLHGAVFPGVRLVTVAPECCDPGVIEGLAATGVVVSLGHSQAGYAEVEEALRAGARGFTHLFNAMSQLQAREPAMVGAALGSSRSWAGIILDGSHVHPACLRIALRLLGPKRLMLVTDAMPPVGGKAERFELPGVTVEVANGECRGPDGTLGGSLLTMAQAFRNATQILRVSMIDAAWMASTSAAHFLGLERTIGAIAPGLRADLVHLDDELRVVRSWCGGELYDEGE